ncbi:MAG: SpoIIE family protein phosphatase [Clostridia bacterium]|nr:SpoIIE family protein phosphatase [Clostridia bacterium]
MMQRLKSLRFRILLPMIAIVLFVIALLNTLFSSAFIRLLLQQEQEVNATGFETVSRSVEPMIATSVNEVRNILSDGRVASCARGRYDSATQLVHARISCRDYLRGEIASRDKIFGLLFMRKDGSLFGTLPEGNFFLDDPEQNPLPEDMKAQILNAPLGQTVWVGPLSASVLYGFENDKTRQTLMIAGWKSVNVSYGECYSMILMDESVFDDLFAALQDGKSSWHLFTEDRTEIYHTGQDACLDPDLLISESNSGEIFHDENGLPVCTFSMQMSSPAWTLVRKVSMENYERVIGGVRASVIALGGIILLVALILYEAWLRRFLRQFSSLLKGIVRMGKGDLESTAFESTSIEEFKQMQREINRTSAALSRQMDTIRRMEREQMALENERKEQERIARELSMARDIQASALPQTFPAFPDRTEFDLFASMTPAREVGGDFYDFFLIDSDHLALVIADVSDKGVPAALFMMASKTLIRNELMAGCDPATALERVNLQLCERNPSQMFVTVWLAVLELSTGKGLACNAGHENPCIRRAGGAFELLKYRHDVFVGGLKRVKYRNRAFELHPGDCVFVYTDGVPEATNAVKAMFRAELLIDTLNRDANASPEELIHRVHEEVKLFTGHAPQFDDMTMLCCEYRG